MANPYPARFTDDKGKVRLVGDVDFTDPANQPGGGSQPYQVAGPVSLTAMQIKNLDSVCPEIVASPGLNKILIPLWIFFNFTAGATPYTFVSGTMVLAYSGDPSHELLGLGAFRIMGGATSGTILETSSDSEGETAAHSIDNALVLSSTAGAFADGDGIGDIYVGYDMLDLS